MNHYHCYIGEIRPQRDTRFTGPFKSVAEVVTMTGLPYEEWLRLNKECKELKPVKDEATSKVVSKKAKCFVEF